MTSMRCSKAAALAFGLSLAFAGFAAAGNITVKGSDTMVILGQRWAEVYMKSRPGVAIQVTGGGSGTGIAALLNGTTDLANSSRPIKKKESDAAKRKTGVEPVEFKVAMDGLAAVVNAQNPVKSLTMRQIGMIYTGRFNNWKEVGGPNMKIIRYCRESNSGTYVFFKEHVLGNRDYAADCQTLPGTSAVAEAVSRDKAGIGYGGVAYFAKRAETKILSVSEKAGEPGVSPLKPDKSINFEAVWDGSYPIARYLNVYTPGQPKGEIKAYLDWILSPAGQEIAAKVGYIPLKSKGAM